MSMSNLSVYRAWAPSNSIWSVWVKPVIFTTPPVTTALHEINIKESDIIYSRDTLCIVDLPDQESIEVGLSLAKSGYQPVPLYNGVSSRSKNMLVDVTHLQARLFDATKYLSELPIRQSANPVFLLDARRMNGNIKGKPRGVFDNRWSIFPQDMPSARFLKEQGITKVILFSKRVEDDLSHILFAYQKEGIKIHESKNQRIIDVKKPSLFRSYMYRLFIVAGLKRNSAGGFGGAMPDAYYNGSGRRYYGIG